MNAPLTEQYLTLHEIVAAARSNLAPGPWSYLIGGAETETREREGRQGGRGRNGDPGPRPALALPTYRALAT